MVRADDWWRRRRWPGRRRRRRPGRWTNATSAQRWRAVGWVVIAVGVAPLVTDRRRDGVALLHHGCGEAARRADEKGERQGRPHRAETARSCGAPLAKQGWRAAINGMPAVPRARDVFKMTMCLVGLSVCGLLYRVQGPVQGNQILLLAAFYAVAWWALWFAAPPPARLPIRIVLWSLFASFYLVENSWILVPVVAVLLDLACRLLLRTLPRLAAAEAAARASKQSASDASRKSAAASPTKKKAD